MKTTANTSHIVVSNARHRRGWIPLRTVSLHSPIQSVGDIYPACLMTTGTTGNYWAELRMSNLMAARMIMPGDEVLVIVYDDGASCHFRGHVVRCGRELDRRERFPCMPYRPPPTRYRPLQPVTRLIVEVNLIRDASGNAALWVSE